VRKLLELASRRAQHSVQRYNQFHSDYDAFVILHGTDTMSFTASVLSFAIENLSKTIILTGAQSK
jgi:L-asparaginase/Glu-tRNA(Gln) amidotransferase subunit D